MKNSSVFTKLALGVLVAGSVAACNQNKPTTSAATPASTSATSGDKPTTVYVNSDTLYSKYNYAKDVNNALQAKLKAAQSDMQSKLDAFQREGVDYQKNAATMPADQRQVTEQRLQREQQQLQGYQQNESAQLQDDKAAQYQKVYDKVDDFVKQYSKQNGYKLVLTYSKQVQTVIYGDPSLDITADVVKGLNDAYAKDGAK
ncbi:OmpH/Skp family outer membrane protein [Mucilaginibacter sp.]